MKKVFVLFSCLFLLFACQEKPAEKELRWLGDIAFDPSQDNPEFKLCHLEDQVYQYFNLGENIEFEGEKWRINEIFKKEYNSDKVKKESGLIRIRFIVNCQGETDRFRVLSSNLNYQEKRLDSRITNQLLQITKSLEGWGQKSNGEQDVDYYQYLIFKIVEGKIVKILP